MISTVMLPKDGAAFICTFTQKGVECGLLATRGLLMEDWDRFMDLELRHISIFRALCPDHIKEVGRMLEEADKS